MKKIIAVFLLAALWGMASLCVAAKSYLPSEDIYIHNVGNIQLRNEASPAYIAGILGEVLEFRQGTRRENDIMYVIFEGGTVWLADQSGEADMDTEAMITRAIFTKKDVFTLRGIHIGDDAALVYKKYGQPSAMKRNFMKSYEGIVDVWQKYDADTRTTRQKLYFGIRNGRVAAIAVSVMPANGL